MGRKLGVITLLAATTATTEGGAQAQQPAAVASAATAAQVYEPAFFAIYRPITALDMVEQVPGFSIEDGEDVRGFGGAAGNVLIDGERPSSKGAVSEELGRIPAESVLRIELVRRGAGELDVRGQAAVVNVILAEGAGVPRATYDAGLMMIQGGRVGGDVRWTRGFRLGDVEATLDLRSQMEPERSETAERLLAPDGSLLEVRDEFFQGSPKNITVVGTARWAPSERDALSFNATFQPWLWDSHEPSIVVDGAGAPLRVEAIESTDRDAWFGELGADWERALTPALSMKLVGLATQENVVFWDRETTFTPLGFDEAVEIDSTKEFGERVGRATATWRGGAHTLEAGFEAAQNLLDRNLAIFVDDGGGPVEVDLPVASTQVEEIRGEIFATDVWTVGPRLTVEAGLTVEASRITQIGDAEQEREFTYPKPRVIASYAMSERDQIRLSVLREAAQLDFEEFASAVSLSDGSVNVGNPNLEPERAWSARAEWERRWGERGALTLTAFHDAVEAVQDLVVLGDFTGPGNLGDGTRTGLSAAGTAPLDALGLRNALLRLDASVQETSVDDPLTGLSRSFADESDWQWRIDFRQELPALRSAWGFDYGESAPRESFRRDELQSFDEGRGNLDVFVETTRWGGVTLRLGADNLFNATQTTERRFFAGPRGSSPLEAVELRERNWGPVYSIRVSGTF